MFVYVDSIDKAQEKLAFAVIAHCYKQLINDYNVDILVSIKAGLDDNTDGWCQQNSVNNYEIEVERNLNNKHFIKTLCHEMVHVKQGVMGELVDSTTWRGKAYNGDQPWEVEAYYLEEQLYQSFLSKR